MKSILCKLSTMIIVILDLWTWARNVTPLGLILWSIKSILLLKATFSAPALWRRTHSWDLSGSSWFFLSVTFIFEFQVDQHSSPTLLPKSPIFHWLLEWTGIPFYVFLSEYVRNRIILASFYASVLCAGNIFGQFADMSLWTLQVFGKVIRKLLRLFWADPSVLDWA